MENEIEQAYCKEDYCRKEILAIRDAIGKKGASEEVFKAAYSTLAFIILYGPKSVQDFAQMQMKEAQTRETYAQTGLLIVAR